MNFFQFGKLFQFAIQLSVFNTYFDNKKNFFSSAIIFNQKIAQNTRKSMPIKLKFIFSISEFLRIKTLMQLFAAFN